MGGDKRVKEPISWHFLSLGVSAELSVFSAASEQHKVHAALVSWGFLSKVQRAVAPAGAFRSIKAAFAII